jgi:hypothetical protein
MYINKCRTGVGGRDRCPSKSEEKLRFRGELEPKIEEPVRIYGWAKSRSVNSVDCIASFQDRDGSDEWHVCRRSKANSAV